MPAIRPEVLEWARETAGLSLDDAAHKIGFSGRDPAQRLRAIEEGDRQPSRAQLVKMANAYRRSLLTLYLAEPPPKGARGHDFRTLPQRQTEDEPLVDALLRDIRTRQGLVRSVLEDDPDTLPLPFVGSKRISDGIANVAESIQEALDFDLDTFRTARSAEQAFAYIRNKAENIGVFVMLIGNLGSHHTDLEVTAFRGFAMADPIAPFIVINDHDARRAWSFSLLHELAHLWLGATGISGPYGDSQIERFCNEVAASLLLRNRELRTLDIRLGTSVSEAARLITEFTKSRQISRSMVAYRLFRANKISEETWKALANAFREEWLAQQQSQRAIARERESGPSHYTARQHRLGKGLLSFVERSIHDGSLTPTKAAIVLGVKPGNVTPLLGKQSGGAL
jgi:Zn-dependent peptidase ImmA (M78 family)